MIGLGSEKKDYQKCLKHVLLLVHFFEQFVLYASLTRWVLDTFHEHIHNILFLSYLIEKSPFINATFKQDGA